ncbi:MAG TPA: enoyl-CoA hydratase-related protein [Acidimicrobiales bacterium]|nr:enoyl-CoA hydratase-related protein [Acidimicrobiales bacterium]
MAAEAEPSVPSAGDKEPVILTEVVDRVGTITLNRPARRNALNGELIGALDDAVRQMSDDPDAKVIVLTGAAPEGGQGGFCSGGDVKDGGRVAPGSEKGVPPDALSGDLSRHDLHAAMLLHLMPKPTIAMVGGPAIGAGCSLAAACDLRFASEDAVFSANFSPNGLSGDYGGSFFWTRIAGTALARRLYLLNEKIPAARALELGMVHGVFPPAELRGYTYEIANQLVRTPATLLALVKDNLNAAEDEVERRRWLFANEAENQGKSAKAMMERMEQRQRAGRRAPGS